MSQCLNLFSDTILISHLAVDRYLYRYRQEFLNNVGISGMIDMNCLNIIVGCCHY